MSEYNGTLAYDFIDRAFERNIRARVISIEHIRDLQKCITGTMKDFSDVDENLGRYLKKFDYEMPKILKGAKSIIVIAVPQPISRIYFTLNSKKHAVIMPPMYLFNSSYELEDKQKKILGITKIVENILNYEDFKLAKINLPCKLTAVKSGLGVYGRNNICYINNESSFFWLATYISDMPCVDDTWIESPTTMKKCSDCNACLKNCPTNAIADDRFLIHANKCITLQNESEKDFPIWLKPSWNNSIIGCMRCQIICPVNKKYITKIKDLVQFDATETKMILENVPLHKLPEITYKKIDDINFIQDYKILARNLKVLIK